MEEIEQLLADKARLESLLDQHEAEWEFLDELLREIGFSNGLETVKATAVEIRENAIDLWE